MTLRDRVQYFTNLFCRLQSTSSRLEKQAIVASIPTEFLTDWTVIAECLNGKRIFHYKMPYSFDCSGAKQFPEDCTILECIEYLRVPVASGNLTDAYIAMHIGSCGEYYEFFRGIVNREIKLGIGNSLFGKVSTSPMLAKKYQDTDLKRSVSGYYITEKLDGNRCLAYYDYEAEKWNFVSRNGKSMYVDFDMGNLPTEFVYDGEVLSPEQVAMSVNTESLVKTGKMRLSSVYGQFTETSGLINRHTTDKQLVYNIFDVVVDKPYIERRALLDTFGLLCGSNVRILPVLKHFATADELYNEVTNILYTVTSNHGEGLMINIGDDGYVQKRTNSLLKVKGSYSMDMLVVGIEEGKGKYEGIVGSLLVMAEQDGKRYECAVGCGLSDQQRVDWAFDNSKILGKIVEIEYFSTSRSKNARSDVYSLRFPRLKQVRTDKSTTSID